jgi:hypothetical protein
MIAMQYSITLPADYDMDIIDRRIAEKGHLTDGFPGLVFKAYLSARGAPDNLYAPFYLWRDAEGMNRFLSGPGFAGLTRSFGWPVVRIWSAWAVRLGDLRQARHATRETGTIEPHADLAALRMRHQSGADGDGALASIAGFEPTTWTAMCFRLWDRPTAGGQSYRVGRISL